MTDSKQSDDRQRPARSSAEWVTFAISLLLLSGVVAMIAIQIPGEHLPPAPTVRQAGPVRATGGSFFVPVEVSNDGDDTAQNVQVLATYTSADGTETIADQVVDFLAGGETEELEFVFDEDPREGELDVSVNGYGVP
ncbi:MAG TPA: hypothetical protein VNB24_05625 [Acidimicrobiales bacterium]|nr:hypothetical protein [Acidimicrobiales bacterium]